MQQEYSALLACQIWRRGASLQKHDLRYMILREYMDIRNFPN